MENVSSLAASPIGVDYQLPQFVNEGHCTGYYIAVTIFLIAIWFFLPKKQTSHLEIPFYKASKTKWIFDAETLIKDSYTKVGRSSVTYTTYTYAVPVSRSSLPDQGY
jgi:hypothetical protein